jgi:hypothetical protein
MVVLIVYDYANKMKLIYYYLLVNCTIERSVASAFIDGVLHRETSNWNRILDDVAFLGS